MSDIVGWYSHKVVILNGSSYQRVGTLVLEIAETRGNEVLSIIVILHTTYVPLQGIHQ